MKLILHFLFFSLFYSFSYAEPIEYNPWNLRINERIIHRKHVSHIVLESRTDHYRVTLILSDRFPYNFKTRQHSFFARCMSEKEAFELSKLFDKQLDSGREIYIRLDGSEIIGYRFFE